MNTTTIRVTCDCEHCEAYATTNGYAFPLAALVNPRMAAACGITERNAHRKAKTHRLVATAHDSQVRELQRRGDIAQTVVKFGPWAETH